MDSVPDVGDFPDFAVACGEEASDPKVRHDGVMVRVDELAASRHLSHQDDDLAAVASLGVRWWRYGMPWRLTELEPGIYDWTLWDRAFAACERHGLVPVVDLCHFGLPDHHHGFCQPEWVDAFGRYVDAFARRYPEPTFFTPVNEPMITASFSGLLGGWNDRRASRADYLRALAHVTLANLEALARLDADRDAWWIGAEGFGAHVAVHDRRRTRRRRRSALEQLVWDLHFGVEPRAEVDDLSDHVDGRILRRIAELAVAGTGDRRSRLLSHERGRARRPRASLTIAERVGGVRTRSHGLVRALPAAVLGGRDLEPRSRSGRRRGLARRVGRRPRPHASRRSARARHLLVQPRRPVRLAHGAAAPGRRGHRGAVCSTPTVGRVPWPTCSPCLRTNARTSPTRRCAADDPGRHRRRRAQSARTQPLPNRGR